MLYPRCSGHRRRSRWVVAVRRWVVAAEVEVRAGAVVATGQAVATLEVAVAIVALARVVGRRTMPSCRSSMPRWLGPRQMDPSSYE